MSMNPTGPTSPAKIGAASASTLSPGAGSHSRKNFRSSFQGDLIKHVVFHDDQTLWDRFLVPLMSNPPSGDQELVRKVVTALRTTCLDDLTSIQKIQAATYSDEKRMMKPLDKLFRTIEQETAKHCRTREYFRAFIRKDSTLVPLANPPFGSLSIVKPDFVLADLPPPKRGMVINMSDRTRAIDWRQCPGFVEVKAKSEDLPINPTEAGKQTLTQGGDYARLLMAGRPFLISTYAFFICGDKFCIALCDRSGMVFSPAKTLSPDEDAIEGLEYFVRVVLRFIWDMSVADLGEDSTTLLTPGHTTYQEEYPRHDVGMGRSPGFETTYWTTIGEPLWVSHSLLGRGTSVWRALSNQQTPLILKVSWRTAGRRSETEIHGIIRSFLRNAGIEEPKGLALASTGGDVYDHSGKIVSVSAQRGLPEEKYKPFIDRVLHRVCLTRFGKPIWQYSTLEEFARAMRDAVHAHDVLSSHGILHRDISAGNILIDVDASYEAATATKPERIVSKNRDPQKASGFLSDWEFAWFPPNVLDVADVRTDPRAVESDSASVKVTPGDMMTGTAIFLATEVLLGLKRKIKTVRDKDHDLESFEWVILYTIYEHSIESARRGPKEAKGRVKALMEEFQNMFAAVDPPALAEKRRALLDWNATDELDNIQGLLSFVEDIVGSVELRGVLIDVWQDLIHRNLAVSLRRKTLSVRPEGILRKKNQPLLEPPECINHEDLIQCLESLIPHPR